MVGRGPFRDMTGIGHANVAPRHDDVPFVQYTMPALELRRLLFDIRDRNESFALEYTRLLPGSAVGNKVRVVESGGDEKTCQVAYHGAKEWVDCAFDEIALLPRPGALPLKFLLHNPYPVLSGDVNEPMYCLSSR